MNPAKPSPSTPPPAPQPSAAPDLKLRAEPLAVTRLSKKVLAGLALVIGVGLGAALVCALRRPSAPAKPAELFSAASHAAPDGLANLPKDYRRVPQLGPPLPADLGRPIVAAQQAGKIVPLPGLATSDAAESSGASGALAPQSPASAAASPQATAAQQARQLAQQVREAARTSKLFAGGAVSQAADPPDGASLDGDKTTALPPAVAPSAAAGLGAAAAADHRQAFLDTPVDKRAVSSDRLTAPASPYLVQAGGVIAAALLTGLRSDLPGPITAQVTENVYDSPTGRTLLIPQGARLLGEYDSQVAFGQQRVLLAWTRLILPNGRSIALERQPGADPAGYAGIEDRVDNHWGKLFKAAALSTLLSVGAEAGTSQDENNLAQALRSGAAGSFSQTGQQIVEHELNVQPTLTVRPGYPVRVMVTRDLVLEPYQG